MTNIVIPAEKKPEDICSEKLAFLKTLKGKRFKSLVKEAAKIHEELGATPEVTGILDDIASYYDSLKTRLFLGGSTSVFYGTGVYGLFDYLLNNEYDAGDVGLFTGLGILFGVTAVTGAYYMYTSYKTYTNTQDALLINKMDNLRKENNIIKEKKL